jgi:hypothetical protein
MTEFGARVQEGGRRECLARCKQSCTRCAKGNEIVRGLRIIHSKAVGSPLNRLLAVAWPFTARLASVAAAGQGKVHGRMHGSHDGLPFNGPLPQRCRPPWSTAAKQRAQIAER